MLNIDRGDVPIIGGRPRVRFVCLDLETTGTDPSTSHVAEIGLAEMVAGRVIRSDGQLVRPPAPMPASASAVNGITDEMLAGAPPIRDLLANVLHVLGSSCRGHSVIAGYCVRKFDWPLLHRSLCEHGVVGPAPPFCDVLDLVCWQLRHLRERKLGEVAEHLGVPHAAAHRAEGDCLATLAVLERLRGLLGLADDAEGDGRLVAIAQYAGIVSDFEFGQFGPYLYRERPRLGPETDLAAATLALASARLVVGFGEMCGTPLSELRGRAGAGYLDWLRDNALPNMPQAAKKLFARALS